MCVCATNQACGEVCVYVRHHQPNLQYIAACVCDASAFGSAKKRRAPRCMCACAREINRGYVSVYAWLVTPLYDGDYKRQLLQS